MSESTPGEPTPNVRLYTQSLNPFTEKVAAALALKGIPFERVVSDDPEDLQRWSPIARIRSRALLLVTTPGRRR